MQVNRLFNESMKSNTVCELICNREDLEQESLESLTYFRLGENNEM